MLQGMLRNPLVDPYLTGVSAAAAAAIAIAVLAGAAASITPAIGFVAGLGAAVLVAALARRGGGIDANRLILAGVSLSTLFAAIVTLAIVRAQIERLREQRSSRGSPARWPGAAGTISPSPRRTSSLERSWRSPRSSPLNALRVGEHARSRRRRRRRSRAMGDSRRCVAAGGEQRRSRRDRRFHRTDRSARRAPRRRFRRARCCCRHAPRSAPHSACSPTQSAARIVAPAELPIGVLLAFIGVPAFLYLYLRPGAPASRGTAG